MGGKILDKFSFKDFENVYLKATSNLRIGDREFLPGEVITRFDSIQISGLQDVTEQVTAHGGYRDRDRVFWTTVQEQRLTFSQGVMTKNQFALMVNTHVISPSKIDAIWVTTTDELESDANGEFTLSQTPVDALYIYNKDTGETITDYTIDDKTITINDPYVEVIVNYRYSYENSTQLFLLGKNLFNGFVELEARTRIKDDKTGQVVTGIIHIPQLKLMSDLSIRLGAQANPVVATFEAIGVPVGSRNDSYVCGFYVLSDDIGSDL